MNGKVVMSLVGRVFEIVVGNVRGMGSGGASVLALLNVPDCDESCSTDACPYV